MKEVQNSNQRIQAKLQWLQDASKTNQDNLNNVKRCEAIRYFWSKQMAYPKGETNDLAMNSKNKNITDLHRGINGFKRGCRPRNNLV
jgi:hypothetical protein